MSEASLAEQIHTVMMDCLYKDEELAVKGQPPEGAILVEGLVNKFGLHPGRVEAHKEEVRGFLDQMPQVFHAEGGGGMSFLSLCNTADGRQWGEHRNMEELVVLGIACNLASYCLPRDMWAMLPGGVPYVTFNTKKAE